MDGPSHRLFNVAAQAVRIFSGVQQDDRFDRDPLIATRPRLPAERTQRQIVAHVLERVFRGSAQKLVMQALSSRNVSREELSEIRALLDKMERGDP